MERHQVKRGREEKKGKRDSRNGSSTSMIKQIDNDEQLIAMATNDPATMVAANNGNSMMEDWKFDLELGI